MDENLQSKIRENLVTGRSGQFRLLADLIKTPSETLSGAGGDMAAISELTCKALKDLEFGVERHPPPDDVPGGVTNLVVRHEFAAGPVVALVAHGDTAQAGDGPRNKTGAVDKNRTGVCQRKANSRAGKRAAFFTGSAS